MQSFAGSLERSRLSKVRASTAEQKRLTLLSGNTRFPISRFISDNHKAGGGWGGAIRWDLRNLPRIERLVNPANSRIRFGL